jgi:FMN phosphatase YigB (HAD superfamily)
MNIHTRIANIKESLRIIKIGFDYDGTLTLTSTQELVKRLINSGGNQIYIVSARSNSAELYSVASKYGIPMSRVYAVGSNEKKVEKIKELGLDKFYDNNPDVISKLPGIGVKV